jgi:PAS domain S-box-containing protein
MPHRESFAADFPTSAIISRPKWSAAASLVAIVLTVTSLGLIAVTTWQDQLMLRRVRLFFLLESLEASIENLTERGAQETAASREAERRYRAVIDESALFEAVRPRLLADLTPVRHLIRGSAAAGLDRNGMARDAFGAIRRVHDHAGKYYTERMARYHVASRALSVVLCGACGLLLLVALIGRRVERTIDRLNRDRHVLLNGSPVAMLTVDGQGTILAVNERVVRLTAIRPGRPLTDLFHPTDRPALETAVALAREKGDYECDLPLLNAEANGIDMAWVIVSSGDELTMIGRDVSDHAWMLREISRVTARHAELFEQIRDAALITENGSVLDVNSAGLALFGYSRQSLIGMSLLNLLVDPADSRPFMAALHSLGTVTDYELRLKSADGRHLDCLITATARCDAAGRLIGCQGLARDVTEKKRMLEALQRSEKEYRGLFENAHDTLLVIDPETEEVLDANHQACLMYDFSREELIGRSMETLSADPLRGKRLVQKTREGSGRYSSFVSRQLRRDGSEIEVEINAAEVPYRGRRAILSINRDITERRRSEQAVRESEERFRLLLESVTDLAIFMLDPRGTVVSWNEGAQRITGYAEDDILGRPTAVFYPEGEMSSAEAELVAATAHGRVEAEGWRIRKDGSRFHAAVTLTRIVDEDGALRGFAKVIRDITERKRFEETQQEMFAVVQNTATEWSQTFDAVEVPVVVLDGGGEIRRLNRAAQIMAGRPLNRLQQVRAADIEGEPWQTIARVARFTHDFGRPADTRALGDGTAVWQVSSCVANFSITERLVIVVAYDLTRVTQLEESLRKTEIAAALGALVGGVAHEVRNPLFAITATLDAFEARLGHTPGLNRYSVPLRESVDRLNRLMRDLLEYGKPHPLSVRPLPITAPISAAVSYCRPLADERGIHITTAIGDGLPEALLDRPRMEQVFQNVIDNAVRHSSSGNEVRFEAEARGDAIVCRILDNGTGLDPEEIGRVFIPFYTRRNGGTGLGMSIAQKIVTAHGGSIDIANREGRAGAVVTIVIPSASAAGEAVAG